ncbi:MAG: class I SAM-dependent methyltransferase [Tepidisphaerales bacterium]
MGESRRTAEWWSRLGRVPRRTLAGCRRVVTPSYWVQFRADLWWPLLLPGEVRSAVMSVEGTSSAREARLLAYLAWCSPPGGVWVEIGAWKGRTTTLLVEVASRRADRPVVVSIDPHLRGTWESYRQTLGRFELERRGLEVHRARSDDVGPGFSRPISLLWVDGSHEYDDVVKDIALFTRWVVPGGYVVFDDAWGGHFPGVERALGEWDASAAGFDDLGAVKRFRLFRRRAHPRG